jgi:Sec7-like guanine-nucleotide exchange factor
MAELKQSTTCIQPHIVTSGHDNFPAPHKDRPGQLLDSFQNIPFTSIIAHCYRYKLHSDPRSWSLPSQNIGCVTKPLRFFIRHRPFPSKATPSLRSPSMMVYEIKRPNIRGKSLSMRKTERELCCHHRHLSPRQLNEIKRQYCQLCTRSNCHAARKWYRVMYLPRSLPS